MSLKPRLALIFLLTLLPVIAFAHSPSTSYLFISEKHNTLSLRWDIALRDLEQVIGLDTNVDSKITWQELKAKQTAISAYAFANLSLHRDGKACHLSHQQLQVENHSDGSYAVLQIQPNCESKTGLLSLNYSLLFNNDPDHRGIIIDQRSQGNRQPLIASPDNTLIYLDQGDGVLQGFLRFIQQGVWHILIGFDHILFVVTLLLPAVLYYQQSKWRAVKSFKPALISLFKVITAFTIAHSITLSLATLEVISLPARWVESAIALSVMLVAMNNIKPIFTHSRWSIAFVFGLVHGFGFASVLSDLELAPESLLLSLLGFNLGVELGQSLILFVLFPLAYLLRKTIFYRRYLLKGGSLLIAMLAAFWLWQRILGT